MRKEQLLSIEGKWQEEWAKTRIYEVERNESLPKKFVTFPFPYMSGPAHMGTAYTLTRLDIIARYYRAKGFNVLLPFAFHWTGTTVAGISDRIRRGDSKQISILRDIDGVPEDIIVKKFVDPVFMARYYMSKYREAIKRLGVAVDWRREFHTTSDDPAFSKYVEWQYYKLRDGGYIKQGTHAVVWCPYDKSVTGDHDRLEGEGVFATEFVLVKFKLDESTYVVAATFRPETIFGVTNVWVNPDVEYVKVQVNREHWIISEEAAEKLSDLGRGIKQIETIIGKDLIGKFVEAPLVGWKVPVLPASFVDPKLASGVVYSVPAHAPYDYAALVDIKRDLAALAKYGLDHQMIEALKPISMITTERYGRNPSAKLLKELGISDQKDKRLEQVTADVYREEFLHGKLLENTGDLAGKDVKTAKELVAQRLKEKGLGDAMLDLPSPVVCRCGTRCHIKILQDQYLLPYSDPSWKAKAKKALSNMVVFPEEIRKNFEWFIDWYGDWAFVRTSGLGTLLPWDRRYLIETLSDSTMYMPYYIVAKYVNAGLISYQNMIPEFFDYVILGRGSASSVAKTSGLSEHLIEEVKKDFEYWYPVDLRGSGKDLVANHLTFFIFHHTAIFPEKNWPRGFSINGFMKIEGQTMHKSKGVFIPLSKAIEEYSADATRLACVTLADGLDDPDWRRENAEAIGQLLLSTYDLVQNASSVQQGTGSNMDKWLTSKFRKRITAVTEYLESHQIRKAAIETFYECRGDLKWYLRRARAPGKEVLPNVLKAWVKMMTPFTPHMCEELWHMLGGSGFVSTEPWPTVDEFEEDINAVLQEEYLKKLIEDVQEVMKIIPIKPSKMRIYIAANWKRETAKQVSNLLEQGSKMDAIIRTTVEGLKARGLTKELREVPKTVQKIEGYVRERGLSGYVTSLNTIDEYKLIEENKDFLKSELSLNEIVVFKEGDPEIEDPANRARLAEPMRPSFLLQ